MEEMFEQRVARPILLGSAMTIYTKAKILSLMLFLFIFYYPFNVLSQQNKSIALEENTVESVQTYADLKKETLKKRNYFYEQYKKNMDKDSVLIEAQKYLLAKAGQFFISWYNTPWTFHGHTENPKEGSIACGYFVTTTLRDMGFNIPRVRWAQQASEYVIKKLSSDISHFSQKPMKNITDFIKGKGEGLYIVGLDQHVGYIYYINEKMSFVHANYYQPDIGVMSEPLIGRNPLNDSKYRVIGKLFDKEMVRNWILNKKYSE
jgi:hypothetical protein